MRHLVILILAALAECSAVSWENTGPRCPPLVFPNGRFRTRSRGKIVRFSCFDGYTLVGNKYSTCIRGRWDTPTPVCVNSQCPKLPNPDHALRASKYNGAVSIYFCEPGYVLVGAAEIYCNGRKWNATPPYCRDSTAAAPTSCDFEKGDLCWWEQDPTHDFDWQRHNHDTPSSHIGTGPSHDHTLGLGYDGYYLYVEASGRLVNDTARIVSPLYSSALSETGCFSFWYHMYGATIGALKVYFKPERSNSQVMFEKAGDQGNRWFHGYFNLPTTNMSFQIIIEGIRGASYVSDIAIDDVAILQGENCSFTGPTAAPEMISTNMDEIELVNSLQSCRGRCGNGTSSADAWATILPPGSPDACQCNLDCAETSICCPDFAEYCVLGATDWPATLQTERFSTRLEKIAGQATIGMKPIPISPKDDIDPNARITDRPESTIITRKRTSTPTTPMTPTWRTTTTTKRPTTTKTWTSTRTTWLTSRTAPTNRKTTAKPIDRTKSSTATKRIVVVTPTTGETPFPSFIGTSEDPRDSGRTVARVRAEQATIQQLDSSMSLGVSGITAIVVIGSAIVLSTIMTYLIVRKRKSYKRGGGGSGSALSEDSDVRFLTTDEILDFNLARPTDYDEL